MRIIPDKNGTPILEITDDGVVTALTTGQTIWFRVNDDDWKVEVV